MAVPLKKLSEQHILFVEYYIQTNGSAREAALRAGYSASTATVKGHELKNDPLIAAEIKVRLDEILQAAKVSSNAVIAEIASIAFANIDDYLKWSGGNKLPNPAYVSVEAREEIEREEKFAELMSQELAPKYKRLKALIENPLIDTKTEFHIAPYKVELVNSEYLTRQQKAAVGEVILKPGQFGDTVGMKMGAKLDALNKLANILGLNAPKKIEVAATNLEQTTFKIERRSKLQSQDPVSDADTPTTN